MIIHFPYVGSDKSSKPVPISEANWKAKKLGQYAAGAWTLFRNFLFYIRRYTEPTSEDYKEELVNDSAFGLLLMLLDLIDKLSAPRVKRSELDKIVSIESADLSNSFRTWS